MTWTNFNSKKLVFPSGCCNCRGAAQFSLGIESIEPVGSGTTWIKRNTEVPLCFTCHELYQKKKWSAQRVFRTFLVLSPLLSMIMCYFMFIDDKSISGVIQRYAIIIILGSIFGLIVGGLIGNGVREAMLAIARPAKFKDGRLKFKNPGFQAEYDKLNQKK